MSAKSMKNGAFSVDVSLYSDWSFPVSSLENIQASIAPSVESLNNYIAKKYEPASESESGSSGEIFQYGVDNLEPIMDQRRIHKVTTGFVVKCTRCSAKLTMRFNASASELRVRKMDLKRHRCRRATGNMRETCSLWAQEQRRLEVFWVDEDQWFPGFIESYNSETNKHTIRYDDGEVEDIVLWGKKPEVHTFRFLEAYDNYNEGGENRGDSNEATENNRIETGNGLTHNLNPLWKTLSDLQANGTVTDNGGRDISLLTASTEKGKRPLQDGAFVPRSSKAVRPDEADKSLTVLPGLESVNRSFEEVADHLRAERDRLQNENKRRVDEYQERVNLSIEKWRRQAMHESDRRKEYEEEIKKLKLEIKELQGVVKSKEGDIAAYMHLLTGMLNNNNSDKN